MITLALEIIIEIIILYYIIITNSNMTSTNDDMCIICLENGVDLDNTCKQCNGAFIHKDCFDKMKKNNINKCPICRHELIIDIHESINIQKIMSIIKYIIFIIIIIFHIYIIFGYIGCLSRNNYPNVFSIEFVKYAAIILRNIIIVLFISINIFLFFMKCYYIRN